MLSRSLTILALLVLAFFTFASPSTSEAAGHPRLNERFSLNTVRMLHSAEMTYAATSGNGLYGNANHLLAAQLIDPVLATGQKYGYNFAVSFTHPTTTTYGNFVVSATPQVYGKTGRMSYFINADGEIHGGDTGGQPATINDPYIDDCTTGTIAENQRCTTYSMRAMVMAEYMYWNTTGSGQFGSIAQLGQTGLITQRLASGTYRGYVFTITTIPGSGQEPPRFRINATPQTYGTTAVFSYYADDTAIIRGADKQGGPADQNDPPI